MTVIIRPYQDGDITALARVYKHGIRQVGLTYYTAEQVEVWSSFADDTEEFEKWVNGSDTFVALDNEDRVVGFTGLESTGRIASLFVAPEVMNTGVGAALLSYLMHEINQRDIKSITTDASEFSKPLFEKFGFQVNNLEQTRFKGLIFQRYQMILKR
jgi:putative acetyltransferase